MPTYSGRCHCGAVRFRLRCDPITTGCRCNCSVCVRKGAVMSDPFFPPEAFEELVGTEALAVYRFGDAVVNHYFCRTCGIYTFHDVVDRPGHRRINLGCLDEVDPLAVSIRLVDGRSF